MKIAILISLCSKNQDWNNLSDIDFVKYFINTFHYTLSGKHDIKFYLGFDCNDEFFIKFKEELEKRFGRISKIIELPIECNGNPCQAWNILYKNAYEDGHDYFYQCGSDVSHAVRGWDDYFVNIMKKSDNDAIVGGIDPPFWMERVIRDMPGILENVFTGRKHYERFGWFFPPEVKTWYSDDMITKIYRNVNRCFVCPNIKYINRNRVGDSNEASRYVPPKDTPISKNWAELSNNYSLKFF